VATLNLVIVHQPEQVEAVLKFALDYADGTGRTGDEWVAVFRAAAELAGARVPIMPTEATIPLPPGLRLS
jgi:hypothetical protein